MRRLPGSHPPNVKNRSSKHYTWLTKIKPIVRCVNNETLKIWSSNGVLDATKELKRRREKDSKKTN